ncbi:trans-sialidase [Trypanosoma theileri]|uniref:Trans-sialidase n=1 Tax=Trypanosoma theileri TaxID=67003 RepID=A0A1X0NYM9_9TRYP|nr:trans-sialidase [Trypanosoma theileri]ORC89319.1 trans-sialidase [Trypanosoma theileri]
MLGCISGYAQGEEPQEKTTLLRTFNGSHILELENGQLVAINGANLYPRNGSQPDSIELLTPANGVGENAWWNTNRDLFRFHSYEYNPFVRHYGFGRWFRAMYALVESNNPPSQENSVLHIVWMNTLNGVIEKNSFTYTTFNIAYPFMEGTASVVRFPADTISKILTTKNNTLLFPVQFVTEDNKVFSTVLYYRPHDKQWNVGGLTDEGTYNPTVMEWENDKLMMITQHTSGYYRVYESTDLGKNWKESISTLSRVWATSTVTTNKPTTERGSQNNFITATIDNKSVILFTQSVVSGEKKQLHLWLTDNTHIYYVGFIATDPNAATSTLLFKNGELYFRYLILEREGNPQVLFVDLSTAMERIKSVVKKWTEQDQTLTESRCCTDENCASSECRIPTTGLVGYLSGNIDGDKWRDEYLGVNAVLIGTVMKVTNGLKFMGPGSGAIWPVSINVLARQYHFTNYAFTLVATVTIHKVPKNDSSPLLGVRMWDNNKHSILLGVSYNNDKTWSATNRGTKSKSTGTWEVDNESSLVLTFKNGTGSVYINSTRLHVGTNLNIEEVVKISHFYFGWDGESVEGSHISVKDVMLYNRVLSKEEIAALLRSRMNISFSPSDAEEIQEGTNDKSSQVQNTETPQDIDTPTQMETTNASATVQPESQPESQENQQPAPVVEIPPEKTQQEVNTTENKTSTETTVPDSSTNTMQQDLLQNTTQSMINNNVNAHKNKSIDGTVRIYESVLPMLLLVLWALATVFP